MKWLKSILSDINDNPSSKRLTGFILVLTGIVLAFLDKDYTNMILVGAGLIGLGVADNFLNVLKK